MKKQERKRNMKRNTKIITGGPYQDEEKKIEIFTCEICSINYEHKGQYTDHLKTHANQDVVYECSQCPCFFKNAGHLHVHIQEVHEKIKKQYKCNECTETFPTSYFLIKHKRKMHVTNKVYFDCKFCHRPYASKNALKWHINLNHNKDFKRSKCPYCPCDFKWPDHLKVHIRKKHVEQGHTPTDLIKRGLTSIRRKTNDCVVCKKKFEKKLDLMLHLKNAHQQELDIFTCCLCEAVYTHAHSLKIHLEEHRRKKTGDENHKCEQCHPYPNPKKYLDYTPISVVQDDKPDIEREVIDFELSLMEHEDIREIIRFRLRHAKRPKRKPKNTNDTPINSESDYIKNNKLDDIEMDSKENTDIKHEEDNEKAKRKGKYHCYKCNLYFNSEISYLSHLKDHSNTGSPFAEDNKDNKVNANKRKEMRIHLERISDEAISRRNGASAFQCDECGLTFALESSLNAHKELGHDVKILDDKPKDEKNVNNKNSRSNGKLTNNKYKCCKCIESFATPLELGRHMKAQHHSKVKCNLCKSIFESRAKYNTHMRLRHKRKIVPNSPKKSRVLPVSPKFSKPKKRVEKVYECGKCEVFFPTKLELLRHISDVHM